jgi:hypothetical protein
MHKDSEKTWLAHLAENRRYPAMAGLGFSSGLPFLLVYSTQTTGCRRKRLGAAVKNVANRAYPAAAVLSGELRIGKQFLKNQELARRPRAIAIHAAP